MKDATVVIKVSDLETILEFVSSIIQKTAEAEGTLKIVDDSFEDIKGVSESQAVWALRNAYRNVESATNDAGAIQDAIEIAMRKRVAAAMTTIEDTIIAIERATDRIGVSMDALNLNTDETRQKYYSSLDQEDLPHNMEMLFTELRTIHQMLYEELSSLRDHTHLLKQERDKTNVQ